MGLSAVAAKDGFGLGASSGLADASASPDAPAPAPAQNILESEEAAAKSMIRKARLLNDHLLLEKGARVAHLGCESEGALTYALAQTSALRHFVGIHQSQSVVDAARNCYALPNLEYVRSDFLETDDLTFDAIILSDYLHKAYSETNFSKKAIAGILEACLKHLKPNGQLLIKDHAVTNPDRSVILELPYFKGRERDVELLEWFAENVRTSGKKLAIEEIEGEAKHTRLFKMPYKWAYEFIIGKDRSENWENNPPKEFTPYTPREYQKLLEYFEFRVLYVAPFRDEPHIRNFFHERFRILSEDGRDLGFPPTCFFIVAQKKKPQESLYLYEEMSRRKPSENLNIKAMQDEKTGHVLEIVERNEAKTDLIPYRITSEGNLNVFLTESVPQCLSNTLISEKHNLDGRQWSGHMTQAIEIDDAGALVFSDQGEREVRQFIYDQTGLMTAQGVRLEKGPSSYPAPDYIDELKSCYFIEVCKNYTGSDRKAIVKNAKKFLRATPLVRELNAQDVLNSINVGLIPNETLELQITALMVRLGIRPENQEGEAIPLDNARPARVLNRRQILSFLSRKENRFKATRERPGDIAAVRSSFVDEGKIDNRLGSLGSQEEDFVVFKKQTINTAMVIPLTRDLGGEILAGFEARFLPVPERVSGSAKTLAAPTFPLPKEVSTFDQAKEYVAAQFNVMPDRVGKLGESYFCHIDMTPHRVYPFVVATAAYDTQGWGSEEDGFTGYAPLDELWKIIYLDNTVSFLSKATRLFTRFAKDSEHSLQAGFSKQLVVEKISSMSNLRDVGDLKSSSSLSSSTVLESPDTKFE